MLPIRAGEHGYHSPQHLSSLCIGLSLCGRTKISNRKYAEPEEMEEKDSEGGSDQ